MPPNALSTGPEVPAPSTRERDPAQSSAITRRQEATRNDVGNVLHQGIGDRISNAMNSVTTPIAQAWKPLPALPSAQTIGKAALVGSALTMPVATTIIGGGAYAGIKTWNKLAQYRPFAWVDRSARTVVSGAVHGVMDGMQSVVSVASYPFRAMGTIGANVLRIGARATARTLDATVGELFRDVENAINHKFNFPKGTNLFAQILLAGKAMGYAVPNLLSGYFRLIKEHPIAVPLGTLGALGLFANAEWSIIGASKMLVDGAGNLFNLIMQLLQKQIS